MSEKKTPSSNTGKPGTFKKGPDPRRHMNGQISKERLALSGLLQNETDLAPARLKETWQMKRVFFGKEPKKHFGLVRIKWRKASNTIVKDAGNTATGIIHPSENRRLTIPEIKRLSSFPDSYHFIGHYKDQWARIGNAVMPKFMEAIAETIRKQCFDFSEDEVRATAQ